MPDERRGLRLPQLLILYTALAIGGFELGFFSTINKWWIGDRLNDIRLAFEAVAGEFETPWYLDIPASDTTIMTYRPEAVAPGLVLVSGITADSNVFVHVIERDGAIVQAWAPDWFEIWPENPREIPVKRRPNTLPGAVPHGQQVLDDGSLLMNYESLSTIRLSVCGELVWRRLNFGHHSIEPGPGGSYYVGAERSVAKGAQTGYDNHQAPLASYMIEQLDIDGNVLMSKEILEILKENDLTGLMFLSTLENIEVEVTGDTMHLNDIEMFPEGMQSDVFEPGDLMVSLRNINTILVVDPETWKVKFQFTGGVLRHHDPDFVPGDKILVFDNRNLNPLQPEDQRYSRIVEIDARTGTHREFFRGQGQTHFYTPAMGRQQLLPNGNLLITSTQQGRAFEVDPGGSLVWEFNNVISDDNNAVLMEANLLPLSMDRAFFEARRAECGG